MSYQINNAPQGGYEFANSFDQKALTRRVSAVMRRVYLKMTLALVVTALTSFLALGSELYWDLIASRGAFLVLAIVQVGLVITISAALHKLSSAAATSLFYLYAVVTGLFLAPLSMVYTEASIVKTLVITASTFGAMSVYGYFTSRDLTTWGRYLFFALIGLIICTVINIFAGSPAIDYLISWAGVLIFIGLTAWDTQKIRQWAENAPGESTAKLATVGALSLYLDFINLFIYLLRLFGDRR